MTDLTSRDDERAAEQARAKGQEEEKQKQQELEKAKEQARVKGQEEEKQKQQETRKGKRTGTERRAGTGTGTAEGKGRGEWCKDHSRYHTACDYSHCCSTS